MLTQRGIYQDVVDLHGFDGAYHSFNSFCERLQHKEPEQSDRLSFFPCAEIQVNYDEDALVRVQVSRSLAQASLVCGRTQHYSCRSFRRVVWKSTDFDRRC